jgi:hypothetical protein
MRRFGTIQVALFLFGNSPGNKMQTSGKQKATNPPR